MRKPSKQRTSAPALYSSVAINHMLILFSLETIALLKAEVSRLQARPKGFPIALWKPSGPSLCCKTFHAAQNYVAKGLRLCGGEQRALHSSSLRLRRTRHWRAVALCNPSPSVLIFVSDKHILQPFSLPALAQIQPGMLYCTYRKGGIRHENCPAGAPRRAAGAD